MSITLEQIVQTKRAEVEARKSITSIDDFRAKIKDLDRPRNFFAAVTRDPQGEERAPLKLLNVIAEVKQKSPFSDFVRNDFDPVSLAIKCEQGGADAISCPTDEMFYHGKIELIQQIKQAVKLPILRKDFILDPWQIYESAFAGADAIQLIAECFATNELIDLSILATELHLTTLIEVHSIENLMRVRDSVIGFPMKSYSLLCINNRNLETMKVDLSSTLRMLDLVDDRSTLVSESGITSREQIEHLAKSGVRTVLVGETLMRQSNLITTMRELFWV